LADIKPDVAITIHPCADPVIAREVACDEALLSHLCRERIWKF
jgi:hypothetical protein